MVDDRVGACVAPRMPAAAMAAVAGAVLLLLSVLLLAVRHRRRRGDAARETAKLKSLFALSRVNK